MPHPYRFDDFEVWPARRTVLHAGHPVAMGARAFDVLITLIEGRARLVTKRELLDAVWPGLVVEEANVQVQVSMLRKVLGPAAITTIPGLGYRFVAVLDAGVDEEHDTALQSSTVVAAPVVSLGSVGAVPRPLSNVPTAVDALIGREEDIAAVSSLLGSGRLVTVLGPGGIGKTRVAQEVARPQVRVFSHGVWWVDLAAITNPAHIAVAIANAAHADVGGDGSDAIGRLVRGLEERHMLLVLDNCEHLIADVSDFVQRAQSQAGKLSVLVTTQEALRITGELTHRLGPLACPPDGSDLEQARASSALRLLERRAQSVDRRFRLTSANVQTASELVQRLDGNPLAIEMAAARVPSLGLEMLKLRLNERFELLRSNGRVSLARHQTLLATLEWSNSLLSSLERSVLRRLSAFVGSFRVDVAQTAVMEERSDEWAVLEAMSALVDKSLLQIESLEPPRYRLLETVRLFCAGQLRDYGDVTDAELHHGRAMGMVATEIERFFWEMSDVAFLARYAPDYDDLQAALDRARARGDVACAAITGCALMRLDHLRSLNAPRLARAEALYAMLPAADAMSAAWIWTAIAAHGLIALEAVSRIDAAVQAVQAWRAQGDPMRLHFALGFHASESARIKILRPRIDSLTKPARWSSRGGPCAD